MGYLRYRDYAKQIQDNNFLQIVSNDLSLRLLAEAATEEECISYLIQKYDVVKEFRPTTTWSPLSIYNGDDLIELNYTAYITTATYAINDLVSYSGVCYICTAVTTGVFDPTKWTALGAQYDLFFATLPYPMFDVNAFYTEGQQVFWNNNTYTCKITTVAIGHDESIQYGQYQNIPLQNVFPDDPVKGLQYWGAPVPYSVAAGTLPTNTSKWTKGDNRSQQLVMYAIDICLYHLHSRIAPNNIPELRIDRYEAAIAWLKMANTGKVSAAIPKLQPAQGRAIRYGGNVKNINTY